MSARASHSYGELSRPRCRLCKISYRIAAAAALTPSDSMRPCSGSAISSSQAPATRGRSPLALAAEHEHDARAGVVGRVVGDRPVLLARAGAAGATGARPVAPAPGRARIGEEVGDVAHARDAQVLDGSGGRLADRRRDLGGAALGDHHAAGAGALGGAADRAEVLWVLDLVERDDQRLRAREQLGRARRRDTGPPRRRRPGARSSRSGARSPRAATMRRSQLRQPRLARGAIASPTPRPRARRAARAAPRARGCARRGSLRRAARSRRARRGPPSRARRSHRAAGRRPAKSRSSRARSRCSASASTSPGRRARAGRAGARGRARRASRAGARRRRPSTRAALASRDPLVEQRRAPRRC